MALAILLEHMHKKFEINWTKIKIKGGCRSGRKEVTHNSNSDLPLVYLLECSYEDIWCVVSFLRYLKSLSSCESVWEPIRKLVGESVGVLKSIRHVAILD